LHSSNLLEISRLILQLLRPTLKSVRPACHA
jgi:hypothetical protein